MIEKRHQLLFEKRQPMFHSGEPSPVADRLIERIAGGGRAEDFTIAASETLDALCVQQGFGRRQQGEAVDSARCPLVCRIEAADTLDFVAEEIEPQRLFLARREKVYDPAAHSELARAGHCFHTHKNGRAACRERVCMYG